MVLIYLPVAKLPRVTFSVEANPVMKSHGESSKRKGRKNAKSRKNAIVLPLRRKRHRERTSRDRTTSGDPTTELPGRISTESTENPGNTESLEKIGDPEKTEARGKTEVQGKTEAPEKIGGPEKIGDPESPEEEEIHDSDTMTETARDTITREGHQGPTTEIEITESLVNTVSPVVIVMLPARTTPVADKIEETDPLSTEDLDPRAQDPDQTNQPHQLPRRRRSLKSRHNPQSLLMTKRRSLLLPRGQ